MSKQPIDHVSLKIKRKRALVWPFATCSMYEHVVKLLVEDELVKELSPPEAWRIHPSIETRGKGLHHERRLLVKNVLTAWHITKLRQHAQDPKKSARRSGFTARYTVRPYEAIRGYHARTKFQPNSAPIPYGTVRYGILCLKQYISNRIGGFFLSL